MKPRLARGVRLRPDPRDGTPVLLSPERGLRLSATAAAVLTLCDGARDLDEIVSMLTIRYAGADRGRIDRDVRALLADMRGRGLIEGGDPQGERVRVMSEDTPAPAATDGAPYTLVAELTHRCPLACPYCSHAVSSSSSRYVAA